MKDKKNITDKANIIRGWLGIDRLAILALLVLMTVSPYKRGLFFAEDYLPFNAWVMGIFIVILAWALFERLMASQLSVSGIDDQDSAFRIRVPNRPIDLIWLLLPLAYLISMIGAVEPGLARNEFLRNLTYMAIALTVLMTVRTRAGQVTIAISYVVTATWVAFYGYGAMYSLWEFTDAMFGSSRLSSVFQYPNTLAAFASGAGLLAIFLAIFFMEARKSDTQLESNSNTWSKLSYIGLNFVGPIFLGIAALLFATVFSTGSRAGAIVLIIAYILSVILVPLRVKLTYLVLSASSLAGGLYLYTQAANRVVEEGFGIFMGKVLLIAAVLYGLALALGVFNRITSRDRKVYIAGQIVLALLIALAFVYIAPMALDIITGNEGLAGLEKLWQRLATVLDHENQSSASARLDFFVDSLKIYKDYPAFGAGGGAWQGLFQVYQDYPYWSTQAHIYYFQLMAEVGTFGLLALTVIFVGICWTVWRVWRQGDYLTNIIQMGILSALLVLFGHSAADFDMSYSIYGAYVWLLMATLFLPLGYQASVDRAGSTEQAKSSESRQSKLEFLQKPLAGASIPVLILLLIIVVAFFINVQSANAISDYQQAALMTKENPQQAFAYMERAYARDSRNTDVIVTYSTFLRDVIESNPEAEIRGHYLPVYGQVIDKAAKDYPYNTKILSQLINYQMITGQGELASATLDRLIEAGKYTGNHYNNAIEANYNLAMYDKVTGAYELYYDRYDDLIENEKPNVRKFVIQKSSHFYAALAYYELGNHEQAREALAKLANKSFNAEDFADEVEAVLAQGKISQEQLAEWLEVIPKR